MNGWGSSMRFQSTLPREERRSSHCDRGGKGEISIHAPTRGATATSREDFIDQIFQSTLPREERRRSQEEVPRMVYFNPRSHERSDNMRQFVSDSYNISIHAPTRGATCQRYIRTAEQEISIHAPTRGATAILHKKFIYFYTIPTINI